MNRICLPLLLAASLTLGGSSFSGTTNVQRSPDWAQRVAISGVENAYRVDAGYYRGAQPSRSGVESLRRAGIKTVVNLRTFHSDKGILKGSSLRYEHIWFKTWHPEDEDVFRFLSIVTDPERQPVFVHCRHGADRTGLMTAVYRIVVQNWTKEMAIREMTDGGFNFHPEWKNLPRYIDELDTDALRRRLKP